MLGERIARHGAKVFLVNTGWNGGPFGVGRRIDIDATRAMIEAATSGALDGVATRRDPIFNLDVPMSCPGIDDTVLDARGTWRDQEAYEDKARELARLFAKNFERFADSVPAEVREAGPVSE
jgi:phosphoenolpyruvate carboxykinase (ATP)